MFAKKANYFLTTCDQIKPDKKMVDEQTIFF